MSWEKVKLGEISFCIQPGPFGSQLHNSDYADEGTPIIMPKDMVDGHIRHTGLIRVPEEHVARLQRHQVCAGNLMVARKGDVRKCVYITENENGWLTGSDCLKVALNENVCFPKYIYYQLRSPYIGRWLEQISIGATMPSINTGLLSGIEMYLPSLEIQRRIADILSAYDDLIENNRKQIKLLEEAAQRLYKEWFVDLRFPGHEHTKIMDGVPEGWERAHLSDIADINANNIPKNYCFNYIEYTDLSAVQNGIIREKTRYALNEAPGRAKRMANDGDIIWGMVRPNLKSFALVLHPTETDVFSTGFCVLSAKKVPFTYLYYAVTTESFIKYLVNCTNGAAYPAVKPIHFSEAEIILPHEKILKRFNIVVEPMLRKREKLLLIINQASQARDRLLPKLMSGEVEV